MMMTELRVSREINIPSFFVATDYTCSPGVSEIVADRYFIPHEKLREEFASQGIPASRIVASGIPVREEFCQKVIKVPRAAPLAWARRAEFCCFAAEAWAAARYAALPCA